MKKILSFIVIAVLIINTWASVPSVYEKYIDKLSIPVEYRKVHPSTDFIPDIEAVSLPETISSEDAIRDVDEFLYLLQTGYSGYDFFRKQGVDFIKRAETFKAELKRKDSIRTIEFEKRLASLLTGVNDGHLKIFGNRQHSFFRRRIAYFTEILVEKRSDGSMVVVNSAVDDVPEGSLFLDSEEKLFPTLSPKGRHHFLVGQLSEEDMGFMSCVFRINGDIYRVEVPMHSSWVGWYDRKKPLNSLEVVSGVPVLRLQDMRTLDGTAELTGKTDEYSKVLGDSDSFILNLFSSSGSDQYVKHIIENINGSYSDPHYKAELISPATVQANTVEYKGDNSDFRQYPPKYSRYSETMKKEPVKRYVPDFRMPREKKGYSGKAVVFANRHTVSGAEDAVIIAKESFEDVIVMGENTAGMTNFGEVRFYRLPASGIWVSLSSVLYISGYDEGEGVQPDIWLDCSDPVGEVTHWLENPDDYMYGFSCILPENRRDNITQMVNRALDTLLKGEESDSLYKQAPLLRSNGFDADDERPAEDNIFTFSMFSNQNLQLLDIDSFVKKEGQGSLRLRNSYYTDVFGMPYYRMPEFKDNIRVTFFAKGKRLVSANRPEYGAFVMLVAQDSNGETYFDKKEFEHTFDWQKLSVSLELKDKKIEKCYLFIGNMIPGTLNIDSILVN
ncbi:MAG: hypothetical protein ACOCWO_02655 [Candidatus Muiribacteriaceae bacterium]